MNNKSIFAALAVTLVLAANPTARAGITVTTGTADGSLLDTSDDLVAGRLFDAATGTYVGRSVDGTDATGVVLTDGTTVWASAASTAYCIDGGTVFVWTLASPDGTSTNAYGYDISSVTAYFSWAAGARAGGRFNKIRYATFDEPDTWVDTGLSQTANSPASGKKANYVDCAFSGSSVPKNACKVELTIANSRTSSIYGGLIEVVVRGTPASAPAFYEVADWTLSNPVTGSEDFLGTGATANCAGFAAVPSATRYQITESADASSINTAGWLAALPSSYAFSPSGDADLAAWVWYNDPDNADYILRRGASQTIRYTTAAPSVVAQSTTSQTVAGRAATLALSHADGGSTGGTSGGTGLETRSVPILSRSLTIVSGPAADLDSSDETITVDTAGQYTVRLTVVNEAGNSAYADATWTVEIVSASEFVWNGSVSTDWDEPSNWTPAVVPESGDDVRIPAGTANNLNLPAADLPASGAFGTFEIESGATVVALGDTTAINEAAGGTVDKPYGRGSVVSAASFTINGTLSADGQGFAGSAGPGGHADGAAHGGAANMVPRSDYLLHQPSSYAFPYGSAAAPTELGSGANGRGGGAIKLVASGDISVNGTVTANGAATGGSRGSGGSIWLVAGGGLSGSGTISAAGRISGSRSGGGGRIRLDYDTTSFAGTIDLHVHNGLGTLYDPGMAGTLYDAKRFPVGTAESPANVTIGSGEDLCYVFPDDGLTRHWNLTITAKQAGFHAGNLVLHSLSVASGSSLTFAKYCYTAEDDMQSLVLPADFTVAAGTFVQLPGAEAIPSFSFDSLTVEAGGILAVGRGDANFINEDAGGTDAIPLGRGTTISCGSATIAGALSATGQGFGIGVNPDNRDGGTAHGGSCEYSNSGGVWRNGYGHFTRPIELGGCWGTNTRRGYGGGAIKLDVAGTLALSGTVEANGSYSSAGAGGSVWVRAARIEGNGSFSAVPGECRRPAAGGRIAVEAADWAFSGTVAVDYTTHYTDNKSYAGTVFTNIACGVAAIGLVGGKPTLVSSYDKEVLNSSILPTWSSDYWGGQAFVLSRRTRDWRRSSMSWTEGFSLAKDGSAVANAATYKIDNLTPGAKGTVSVNGVESAVRVGSDGALTVETPLVAGENTIDINLATGLTLYVR